MSSAQRAAQRPITEKITDRNHEERKPLDASPAAITLAMLLTDEELDSVRCCGLLTGPRAGRRRFPPPPSPSRSLPRRGPPKPLGPAARRPGPDPRPTGRGHGRIPGGASGLLARDSKGKEADRLVTRIGPGGVSLVAGRPS
jgi:hypothetical protein